MTILDITKNTLKTHRENGLLYAKKVGGIYYYAYQEIHELLQKKNNRPILKEMEDKGEIKIMGAVYNMDNGNVEWLKGR